MLSNHIKFFSVLIILISTPLFVNSQEQISVSGITITSSELRCDKPENGTDNIYISIKIENTTSEKLSVRFVKQMWYNNECVNCESNIYEYTVNLILNPNQVIEGTCNKEINELLIFHSMPSGFTKTKLTKYEFADLQIETIKN